MDQVPSEILPEVLKHTKTLELGRMMQVSRGLNHLLETNPFLWRIVDLDKPTSKRSAFEIIDTFAHRSNHTHTLTIIKVRDSLSHMDQVKLLPLLKASKATLRRIDLDFHIRLKDERSGMEETSIRFFHSFSSIEGLNSSPIDYPEAEEQIPGLLTMQYARR